MKPAQLKGSSANQINQLINVANKKFDSGDYQGAMLACDQAVKLDPHNALAYHARGVIKYNLKQYHEAIEDYNYAIELNPNYTDAYYARAATKLALVMYKEAIADLDTVIRLDPKNASAYLERGLAKYGLANKQFTDTIEDSFYKGIPYDEEALYHNRKLAGGSAIADINYAISLNPNNARAWEERGLIRLERWEAKEAVQDLSQALRLDPQREEKLYDSLSVAKALLAVQTKGFFLMSGAGKGKIPQNFDEPLGSSGYNQRRVNGNKIVQQAKKRQSELESGKEKYTAEQWEKFIKHDPNKWLSFERQLNLTGSRPSAELTDYHQAIESAWEEEIKRRHGQGAQVKFIYAQASHDYQAKHDNSSNLHLSFKKGDTLEIKLQKGGWWWGKLHGQEGYVPANHLRLISGNEPPSKPPFSLEDYHTAIATAAEQVKNQTLEQLRLEYHALYVQYQGMGKAQFETQRQEQQERFVTYLQAQLGANHQAKGRMLQAILEGIHENQAQLAMEWIHAKTQLSRLQNEHDPMYQQYQQQQQLAAEKLALQQPNAVRVFYNTIEQILVSHFTAAISLASGMIRRQDTSGEQMLAMGGRLVGSTPIANIAGFVVDVIGSVYSFYQDRRHDRQYQNTASSMIRLEDALTTAEFVARRLTQSFQDYITQNYLSAEETQAAGEQAADLVFDCVKKGELKLLAQKSLDEKVSFLVEKVQAEAAKPRRNFFFFKRGSVFKEPVVTEPSQAVSRQIIAVREQNERAQRQNELAQRQQAMETARLRRRNEEFSVQLSQFSQTMFSNSNLPPNSNLSLLKETDYSEAISMLKNQFADNLAFQIVQRNEKRVMLESRLGAQFLRDFGVKLKEIFPKDIKDVEVENNQLTIKATTTEHAKALVAFLQRPEFSSTLNTKQPATQWRRSELRK